MTDRIDYAHDDLDDVAIHNVTLFRMERLDSGQFWLRCYRDGKPDVVFSLSSARKIKGMHYED